MLEEINIDHITPNIPLKISLRFTLNFWQFFVDVSRQEEKEN